MAGLSRVRRLWTYFQHGSVAWFGGLISSLVVEPVAMRLALASQRPEQWLRRAIRGFCLKAELRRWRGRGGEIRAAAERRSRMSVDALGLAPEQLDVLRSRLTREREVVVAEVDQDGFFLSHFGPLPYLPTVESAAFMPRRRYQVQLVAQNGWVGVKKCYRGQVDRFLNELSALHILGAAGGRVPVILDVDFDALTITTSLIRGETLRERLARQGAVLRDRDMVQDPALAAMPERERLATCVENGARIVRQVVDESFLQEVYRQLQLVHAAKIAWGDIKTGNVVIEQETGLPWLIDFDTAADCHRMNRFSFRVLCDRDIERFNRHFGCQRWTYRRIREHRRLQGGTLLDGPLYAPVCVGYGIHFGRIWSIGSGVGRWKCILRDRLLPLDGKRVLDLGANNALTSLEMLRAGAREVVAIELSDEAIRQGETLRQLYEWADSRPYYLRYVQASMADLPRLELGEFDLVIALCSLYYLSAEEMLRVAQHVRQHAPIFVLQANHNPNLKRPNEELVRKSRIEFLEDLLKTSGFAERMVFSHPGYLRPLVIGRSKGASGESVARAA